MPRRARASGMAAWTTAISDRRCTSPRGSRHLTENAMSRGWLAVALWLLAGACLGQSPTLDKIRKSGTITLGYVDAAVPFSFMREAEPEGYSVDLCKRIVGDLRRQLKLAKLETRWV